MYGHSLKRAERLTAASGARYAILALGGASAFLAPLLVIVLGLALQHLVSPGRGAVSDSWVLGPHVGGALRPTASGAGPLYLLALVAVSWILAALDAASLIALQRWVHRYALGVAVALRRAIHDQTFVLGPHDLLGVSRSRPEELFAERAEEVRRGLAVWWLAIPRSVVELLLLLGLALAVNLWLTLLVILLVLYIFPFARGWKRRVQLREANWRQSAAQFSRELTGSLRLAPLAIGYSLEWPPGNSFDVALQRQADAQFRQLATEGLLKPVLLFVVILSVSFVLLIVGIAHGTTVAGTVLWGTALLAAFFPALRLYRLRAESAGAEEAAAEILAYLDRQPSVIQVPEAQPLGRITRDITLDRVTIANRDGQRLLDNVSVTIPAGQVAVIVASDGETPLAIAGLFVRFYDPAAGRVLYDDRDISRATLETVRGQAVLVTADGPLFTASVTENIACGRTGFTALQIADAVRNARAEPIVQSLPGGLSAPLAERDPRFRLDESFRLGLARALLREPSLLVAQEPGGPPDESAAHELDAALKGAAQGRTLVVLAARLSTLRSADCIYLFHEAKLRASGKHADLLQTSELYRHLNYVWFNPFRDKAC
jgi:ABC-type multidrug transport system fused ATPase/permease subunit